MIAKMKKLTKKDVKTYLKKTKGWELHKGKLVRKFKFKDFVHAIVFVNKVAKLAEKENHHPDICIYDWNKLKLELYTHHVGGLTEKDFMMANKINGITS